MNNIKLKQNHYYKIKLDNDSPAFFGMFYNYEPNTNNLMFIYNISDRLSIETISIDPKSSIQYITHEEWIHIMYVLISSGYYFEENKGINLIHKPLIGEITYFCNVETGESGFGAYQPNPGDKIFMYTYHSKKEVFFSDLSYEVGNRSNTYLKKATRLDKEYFNGLLLSFGKQWSYALRRIVPSIIHRGRKGELYCYINDRFTLTSKTDEWTATDNNRFNSGNYFRTEDEAQEVLQKFNEILMKRQASKYIEVEQPLPSPLNKNDETGKRRGRPRKNNINQ